MVRLRQAANKINFVLGAFALVLFLGFLITRHLEGAIIFIAFLALLWGLFLNFERGIFLIIIILLLGQLTRIPLPQGGALFLNDLLIPLVFLIWLLNKLVRKRLILYRVPTNLPLLIFIAVALFSLLLNKAQLSLAELLLSSAYLWRFIVYSLVFWMVFDLINQDKKNWRKFYNLIILVGLLFAFLGFLQLAFVPSFEFMTRYGWDPHVNRLLSTFFDPNFAGGFLVLVSSLVLARMLFSRKKAEKGIMFYFFLFLVIAIIFTFSRSAYLAFLISFLIVTLKKSWRLLLLGGLTILLIFFTVPRVQERVRGAISLDVTAKMRLESYKEALEIIKDYPFTGVGYNTLRFVRPRYKQIESVQQHTAGGFDSSFLTIWATTGIFGLLAYLWLYLAVLKNSLLEAFNKRLQAPQKGFALGTLAGTLGLVIHSQFVNSLLYPHIMIYLWIVWALLFSLTKNDRV